MTRDEIPQLVHAHAQGVAKALGWTYVEPTGVTGDNDDYPRYWAEITGPNGEHLSVVIHDGRFSWGVRYPKGPDGREASLAYNEIRQSITVALNRPAEVVAREITRRLLPTYLPQLEAAKLRVAEATEYEDTTRANVRYLAAMLSLPDPTENPYAKQTRERNAFGIPFHNDEAYGDVTVNGQYVKMDLRNVSVKLAATILAAIRDAATKEEA